MGKYQGWSGGGVGAECGATALILIFVGRNGQGRISRVDRFRIGWFELFWWALGCRGCP